MSQSVVEMFLADLDRQFQSGDDQVNSKKQERQNVACVHALYAAIASGNLQAFGDSLSENVQFDIVCSKEIPFSGHASGRSEAMSLVQSNFQQIESQEPVVLNVVAQGDNVVVFGKEQGKLRESNAPYQIDWVQNFRLQNEKVVHFHQVIAESLSDSKH